MKKETSSATYADATRAIISGRSSFSHHGVVNTPVYHASTILHPNVESFEKRHDSKTGGRRKVIYGLLGTPTSFDLEEAIANLEGGYDALLTPSGLAAINIALLAFLRPGDHVLVADSVYAWTRSFSDQMLADLGVEVQYYNPLVGADIASLIRPKTRVIFLESPGSYTFEVQDIPAITKVAREHQVTTILDNTWATPLFFKSFEHGVDVSVHAATKYLSGHSDVMMGAIVCNEASWEAVHRTHKLFGQCVGPDDAYATLRSVRTLPTRLRAHQEQGIALATWLEGRDEIAEVLHPALPSHPGHEIWQRDFLGASGLFSIILKPQPRQAVLDMVNNLELFGIGASWGGYESLLIPVYPQKHRSAVPWNSSGQLLRIHAGLESLDDLIVDLEAGLDRLST